MALDFPASPTTGDRVTLNSVIYEFDGAKWVTIRSLFDRGQFVAGTAVEPGFSVSTDANTGLYAPGADQLAFATGGVERVEFGTSEVVFNDGGIDYDFRIEGDVDVNLVFADASTDRIGIGTSAPSVKIDIEATEPYVTLKNTTEEDTDGGREVRIDFEGEQSGGEASTLARIEVSHDGAADDEKGKVVISTNDGADAATPTTAVTIDSAQKVTIAGDLETNTINTLVYPDAGPLSNRNLIINGAMAISQRGTGWEDVADLGTGDYLLDRFKTFHFAGTSGTSVLEQQQSSDVPTGEGFKTSLGLRVKTAGALPNDGYMLLGHMIEGYNINPLEFGTANAKNVTVSFWAKSSVTGTYSVVLRNINATRTYVKDYDLVGGTWKYVTLTFPGETGGTWNITNGIGLQVMWAIDTGSNWNTAPNVWNTSNLFGSTNQTNTWADTANNTFHLTGVQVEVGSKSTPFEHRSYSDELARCQRYCFRIDCSAGFHFINTMAYNSSTTFGSIDLPVQMRARPTLMTPFGVPGDYLITSWSAQDACTSLPSLNGSSIQSVQVQFTSTGNVNTGYATMGSANTNDIYLIFDGGSEL